MKYYVYIVTCKDNTYYTGYTHNIRKRLNQHNGIGFWRGAKYTKSRRPVFLSHLERFPTKALAKQRELEIKKYNHNQKTHLMESTDKEQILNAI